MGKQDGLESGTQVLTGHGSFQRYLHRMALRSGYGGAHTSRMGHRPHKGDPGLQRYAGHSMRPFLRLTIWREGLSSRKLKRRSGSSKTWQRRSWLSRKAKRRNARLQRFLGIKSSIGFDRGWLTPIREKIFLWTWGPGWQTKILTYYCTCKCCEG